MDRVKAIKVLKPLVDSYVDYVNISMKEEDDDIVEALEMAVEALKADVPDTNVGDMISRQTAINMFEKALFGYLPDKWMSIKILEELPTVQPEPHWISCSERLPEEKQSVLVTDGSVVWVCDIISTDEGYKWEDSHGYWLDLDEWIAWMPLPSYSVGDVK